MKLIKLSLFIASISPVNNLFSIDKAVESTIPSTLPRKTTYSVMTTKDIKNPSTMPPTAHTPLTLSEETSSRITPDYYRPTEFILEAPTPGEAAASLKLKRTKKKPSARHSKSPEAASYSSDSDLPTVFTGLHADIATKHGEYRPRIIDKWNFPKTFKALETGQTVDLRSIEKSASEVWQNPDKFNPNEVAEFTILVESRGIEINLPYWGDLYSACKRAKETKALEIASLLRTTIKDLQFAKEGEVASVKGYGKVNGSGTSSPRSDYGLGKRFENNEVLAYQQAIAKVFAIEEKILNKRTLTSDSDSDLE